jgi:hypothetical protein
VISAAKSITGRNYSDIRLLNIARMGLGIPLPIDSPPAERTIARIYLRSLSARASPRRAPRLSPLLLLLCGSVVTYDGSAFHATRDVSAERPGTTDAWQLMIKHGKDAASPRSDATATARPRENGHTASVALPRPLIQKIRASVNYLTIRAAKYRQA